MTTLKVGGGGVGGLIAYYADLAERGPEKPGRGPVDYYLDPDEPAGRWWGDGQTALGVSGEVTPGELRSVLEAAHPVTGERLGKPFGESSARGFDATFSAPKSVSVLWALTPDPWVRAEVLVAHDHAVGAAMAWFQTNGGVTRRGPQGIHQVDTLGVTAALFRQHTSRTVDPQLHTHAVISAKVQDPTGKWLSLDARFLKFQQRTIGWIYDAALRSELTGRLGVAWTPLVGGQAELAQIPDHVRDLFSQRSMQVAAKRDELIQRWAHEHDGTDPDARTIARLERAAVVASRPAKSHGIDAVDLHRSWTGQARETGLNIEDLRFDRPALPPLERAPLDEATIAGEALRRLVEESSTWLPADLARHVATLVPPEGAGNASDHVALIDRIAGRATEGCVDLAPELPGMARRDGRPIDEHVTDRRLTTLDILEQERGLQTWASSQAYPVEPGPDRQAAAAAAIAGPAQVVLVVGPAGTGKTRTVATAVAELERRGRPVIGLAPSGKAADVLRTEAGCPTDTLAGFLTRHRSAGPSPWPVGTTVILDEAGMAATQDLAELASHARRNNWRIVAVGDPAQLPSVGRGGMFAHWCATVAHHELDTPRRFHEPWEAHASLALRLGDREIVREYQAHGRLHTVHPALLALHIADEHRRLEHIGRTVAITTSSTTTAREINVAIQADRYGTGPRIDLADGTHARAGDQIATRRNDRSLVTDAGHPVRNRQVWTVEQVEPDGRATVVSPERGRAVLPAEYTSRHVELGWAVTGYGVQGDTVDVGIAVLEPSTSRAHAYVAMTRGREANHAWIPDPTGDRDPGDALGEVLDRAVDRASALTALERLRKGVELPVPNHDRDFGREIDIGR